MRRMLIVASLVAMLALAVACGDDDDDAEEDVDDSTPTAAASATESAATATEPAATATEPAATDDVAENVCQANPDPATAEDVVIVSPAEGTSVTSPVNVNGQVAAFEATFRLAIYDAAGNQIVDVQGMSAEGQVLSAFTASLEFTVADETPACLWVYQLSARDGTVTKVSQVPIVLQP